MTLPTPDAQSSRSLSAHSRPAFAAHSVPTGLPSTPPFATPSSPLQEASSSRSNASARGPVSADFSQSWDLATGGFKTLTAKRELVPPQLRREQAGSLAGSAPVRNYLFLLVIVACVVVMLISGGVVLFMTLQP